MFNNFIIFWCVQFLIVYCLNVKILGVGDLFSLGVEWQIFLLVLFGNLQVFQIFFVWVIIFKYKCSLIVLLYVCIFFVCIFRVKIFFFVIYYSIIFSIFMGCIYQIFVFFFLFVVNFCLIMLSVYLLVFMRIEEIIQLFSCVVFLW